MIVRVTQKNNFTYLTGSLLLLLVVSGLLDSVPGDSGRTILNLLTLLIFAVVVKSLRFGPLWSRYAWLLTGAIVVTMVLNSLFGWKSTDYIQLILMLALFAGTTSSGFKQVLGEGVIDLNKVIGSIALFILIGLTWTILYLLMIEMDPGAFKGMSSLPWAENFAQASYFSFVTLTTLGYGDISPANRITEVLVYIEAIVGVFYMAAFVASLITAAQRENLN
jgi:voltage-gated potassium channel